MYINSTATLIKAQGITSGIGLNVYIKYQTVGAQ